MASSGLGADSCPEDVRWRGKVGPESELWHLCFDEWLGRITFVFPKDRISGAASEERVSGQMRGRRRGDEVPGRQLNHARAFGVRNGVALRLDGNFVEQVSAIHIAQIWRSKPKQKIHFESSLSVEELRV